MGISDQFKDKANELSEQAKSAMRNQGGKTEEAEQKAREKAEEMMPGGHEDETQQDG
ncbi:hypothetical protein [Streptomyces tateyamensis]|uniref:hypothetical protein n=1 Tax=Streptomyces tateyamensis TaxID=565073 RepID=UPI0015E8C177|nr:hypothetical protein [Streptomyces tateyamensis]